MIRVFVADNFIADGVNISVVQSGDNGRYILRVHQDAGKFVNHWEPINDPAVAVEPTMTLGNDEAITLLNALHEHFKGPTDARQVRADLDHERQKRDEIEDVIARIALRANDL